MILTAGPAWNNERTTKHVRCASCRTVFPGRHMAEVNEEGVCMTCRDIASADAELSPRSTSNAAHAPGSRVSDDVSQDTTCVGNASRRL